TRGSGCRPLRVRRVGQGPWGRGRGPVTGTDAPAGPPRVAAPAELPVILGADTRFGAPSTFG
ncbi:HAD family hydrolase, partial [Streptomyces sp. NPDC057798]